jgi:DNA gyrase subunit A
VYDIPEGNKNSKGRAIQNLLNIEAYDAVNAFVRVKTLADKNFIESHNIIFCTKQGIIKKTLLEQYSRPRTNGINAISIREDDRVISVALTDGNSDIILANRTGRAVRFNENTVRAMGRTATGVKGMALDENDEVVGMIVLPQSVEGDHSILVLSEQGFGKRSKIEDYPTVGRGCKGVKTLKVTEKTGELVAIMDVNNENDLMIINKSGITIRTAVEQIPVIGRATQGVKVINLGKKNDSIGSVCKVNREEIEEVAEEGSVTEITETTESVENTETNN